MKTKLTLAAICTFAFTGCFATLTVPLGPVPVTVSLGQTEKGETVVSGKGVIPAEVPQNLWGKFKSWFGK